MGFLEGEGEVSMKGSTTINMANLPHYSVQDSMVQHRKFHAEMDQWLAMEFHKIKHHPALQVQILLNAFGQSRDAGMAFLNEHLVDFEYLSPACYPALLQALTGSTYAPGLDPDSLSARLARGIESRIPRSRDDAGIPKADVRGSFAPYPPLPSPAGFGVITAFLMVSERYLGRPNAEEFQIWSKELHMGKSSPIHPDVHPQESPKNFIFRVARTYETFTRLVPREFQQKLGRDTLLAVALRGLPPDLQEVGVRALSKVPFEGGEETNQLIALSSRTHTEWQFRQSIAAGDLGLHADLLAQQAPLPPKQQSYSAPRPPFFRNRAAHAVQLQQDGGDPPTDYDPHPSSGAYEGYEGSQGDPAFASHLQQLPATVHPARGRGGAPPPREGGQHDRPERQGRQEHQPRAAGPQANAPGPNSRPEGQYRQPSAGAPRAPDQGQARPPPPERPPPHCDFCHEPHWFSRCPYKEVLTNPSIKHLVTQEIARYKQLLLQQQKLAQAAFAQQAGTSQHTPPQGFQQHGFTPGPVSPTPAPGTQVTQGQGGQGRPVHMAHVAQAFGYDTADSEFLREREEDEDYNYPAGDPPSTSTAFLGAHQ